MIPIDAAGFIEGDYFAPSATGLSRVRVVTEGGDGAVSAVLGHLTAMVYRRGDPTARCPDVPEGAVAGCALPVGALDDHDWTEFATFADFEDYVNNDGSDTQLWYGFNTGYTNIIFDFDPTVTFNGGKSLQIQPFHSGYVYSNFLSPSSRENVIYMTRFKLDAWTATDGTFFLYVAIFYILGQYVELHLTDTGRAELYYGLTAAPGATYTTIDIGPASEFYDQDRELIIRLRPYGSSFIEAHIYLHDPCGEPVLYYTTNAIPKLGAETAVRDFDRWYAGGVGTPTDGSLWIYQESVGVDDAVYGLTP